ncbi:MAG: PilT/PilU family type 4a pilus ATPase [Armatimonadetes bacterium]|nr:PilT/PilU family type 4a pilus ATPase [Armatimonadota bacterium]
MLQLGGTDLHISSEQVPIMRLQGTIRKVPDARPLTPAETVAIISPFLNEEQVATLSSQNSLDTILELPMADGARPRFRCNFFVQRKGLDGVLRLIPDRPPELESLGLPAGIEKLVDHRNGIVLVTGPSGCGKSTTLAALLHYLNHHKARHVVTLEKPIEYLHEPLKCVISQREVGRDTNSYLSGLRSALREMPDVILVGELVDLETTSMAMTAAETGHLVLATMHTSNATSTIDRVIGAFPASQQSLVRVMLADSLRGILSQNLFSRANGPGRVVASELLFCSPAVANLIREQRTFQIPSIIETGSALGMKLMDHSLFELLEQGAITPRDAFLKASQKSRFESFMEWAL